MKKLKQLSWALSASILTISTSVNAVLGPIPIYLNTEYRTESPRIGSLGSTLSFNTNDIQASGANTFLDFLATVPSVGLVNATGSVPAVFIRGNEARHTLVLVDGISIHDISSPDAAVGYGLSSISLNDIEKVDIIKGSGSVLYGSSAIAGVINIITKKSANGQRAAVSTKFGTNNAKTYTLSASSGSKEGFIRFSHNQYSTDGIDARTTTNSPENGEKDSIDNRATQIKLGNQHYDIGYLEGRNKTDYDNWNGSDNNNLSDRTLKAITINAKHQVNNTWRVAALASRSHSKRNYGSPASPSSTGKFESTNITILNDIQMDNALFNIGLSRVVGKDIGNNDTVSSNDVFIAWQKELGDIELNTGARHIHHNSFGNELIYNVEASKDLSQDLTLTAGYATAFNAPGIYQLHDNTYGNPNLQPEQSKTLETGLAKQYDWGEINAHLYTSRVSSLIGWDSVNSTYHNVDKLKIKGFELLLSADVYDYQTNIEYGYVDSKDSSSNRQQARRPKHTVSLTIDKQYGKFDSQLQIIGKSSSFDSASSSDRLGGYTLLNLSTGYAINGSTQTSLTIKNATDKQYQTAKDFNNPGRVIEIGLAYQF